MLTSQVPKRVSAEWEILKRLRQHRTRLFNRTKYRIFNPAQISLPEIEQQTNLDLLENSLRNVMRRNDLDALLDGGLDETAMRNAQVHLESLCNFMERSAVDSSYAQRGPQGVITKYHRLEALLYQLGSTSWAFDMISGTGRRLFQSIYPETDHKYVERFNEFFNSLTQPSVADICFPAGAVPSDRPSPGSKTPQNQLSAIFDGLDVLLSQFKGPLNCKGHHDVLLNISIPREGVPESSLELFLSTCRIPCLWLESRLDTLSLSANGELCPISDQLCEHIHNTREIGDILHLVVANKEICIRTDDEYREGEKEYSRVYACRQPSKTLKELLEKGAFNPSIFGYRGPRFTEDEKRELAATLISNLALSVVSNRTIKCWDPNTIYFLAELNDQCMRSSPYALCTYSSRAEHSKDPHDEAQKQDLALADTDFELLAKLLLEIKGWYLPSDVPLLTMIEHEMCNNLANQPYLRAVYDCLKFRSLYKHHVRLKSSKGHKVNEVTAVKHVISSIVKGIKTPTQQIIKKRQINDEGPGYAISPDYYQFEMSTESDSRIQRSQDYLIQRPQSSLESDYPHVSSGPSTYRDGQALTKRVRFGYCRTEERVEPATGLASNAHMSYNALNPQTINYCRTLTPADRFYSSSLPRSPGPSRELSATPEPLHTLGNATRESSPNILESIPSPPAENRDFEIAIICALPLEADAVLSLFDKHWDSEGYLYHQSPTDPNAYSVGVIGSHNVVLAHMPQMGKGSAATVAANCRSSFTGIKLALVVGICGAVPFKKGGEEILLGDVVISSGIIEYDHGKLYPNEFERKSNLLDNPGRHNVEIQALLSKLQTRRNKGNLQEKTSKYLSGLLRDEFGEEAAYPGPAEDRLFESSYRHKHRFSSGCAICAACDGERDPVCETAKGSSCYQLGCDETKSVSRNRLYQALEANTATKNTTTNKPAIHLGLVASGDRVMKSGRDRDSIAAKEDIIAFEMEGAGVWKSVSCLVIKGVSDYADCHKSNKWQNYAAATAAACMKAFLEYLPRTSR